jgi:hypothetical protein
MEVEGVVLGVVGNLGACLDEVLMETSEDVEGVAQFR